MKDGFYKFEYNDKEKEIFAVKNNKIYSIVGVDYTITTDLFPGLCEEMTEEDLEEFEYIGDTIFKFGQYSELFQYDYILLFVNIRFQFAKPDYEIYNDYQRIFHGNNNNFFSNW